MEKEIIGCDEAIIAISECLIEANGDFIAEIYTAVTAKRCNYEGDNIISVLIENVYNT